MEIATLCAVIASLRIIPNRSQFFQYESVSMSCGGQENSSEWTVKRSTSLYINTTCPSSSNGIDESHCNFSDIYPADNGVYWCESAMGECFDAINITVTAGSVILEGPAHPVTEGDTVSLHCKHNAGSSSNFTSNFYKNDDLIGSSSTGNLNIHRVSKSHEGLYKCNITGVGESPDSSLVVISAGSPDSSSDSSPRVILPVVGVCLMLILLMLLCLWRSHKDKVNPAVSYTDITATQEVKPRTFRDMNSEASFYSTLSLANMCQETPKDSRLSV
ncbi:low affinity immunoglobulin gamma Fc region receptor II-like isoform X2 [Astatotilapia calliptera]|uniref:low affinity immunoglobulin gamma Fc region receptor II-like isoform X2 n=1 Tax=Astatotilapia calliptera TaxID=8154 RepID=UPI000E40237F|nr:low affinity immunoglobulin gamma Fc region receptor II-like isoform X2 [Astatotilapia calliptera]